MSDGGRGGSGGRPSIASARRPDALVRLAALPRTRLARLPTPLLPAPRLRASLGHAPEILVKMDAETGFALGGNKVRKLEHELAPPRLDGVTSIVTAGGPQSNHCRVTAAAAARLGLRCVLVIDGAPPEPPRGNALLHRLFGAEVRTVADRGGREEAMEAVARDEADAGGRALVVPLGASTPLGALGYVRAAAEIDDRLPGDGRTTWIFVASSSCGTLGGLAAGFTLLRRTDVRLVGISADTPRDALLAGARRLAEGALARLGAEGEPPDGLLEADDQEVGAGYGIPTEASHAALERFARTEGIVLDPVYTAKAAAGLVRWVREGRLGRGDRVVFLHTGGHPALLA